MFLWSIFFVWWRLCQILTLIPTMGMLAWFVHGFVESNALTPNYILILFIVSVLALAWALFTLFTWFRSTTNSNAVAFVDLCFVGAFIAAVYYLRHIANADCTQVRRDSNWTVNFGGLAAISGPSWDWATDKPCAMLKACFAFGIMNCIFFFFTAVLAWWSKDSVTRGVVHERKIYRDGRYHGGSRSRSHRSRSRSHHSTRRTSYSRRTYV
ncbi:hypothetical protein F5X68DRAFT_216981 [Plectosphaerella plurivora]|uniref:MARVEL domain-containing protein n=1 Tax=Plectosphaerella plurivora TaxID=936078 RepID=A0A9P8V2K3_9PEZI|nr:hypothetical protein F5X68DRAFT_216981 [Plectosphaerella plurivora]